jgi:hypothetical protein
MWNESQKWQELRRSGGHSVVRFDVFCGHCKKLISEDVGCDNLHAKGFWSDRPMDVFCDSQCAMGYQAKNGVRLMNLKWTGAIQRGSDPIQINLTEIVGVLKMARYEIDEAAAGNHRPNALSYTRDAIDAAIEKALQHIA